MLIDKKFPNTSKLLDQNAQLHPLLQKSANLKSPKSRSKKLARSVEECLDDKLMDVSHNLYRLKIEYNAKCDENLRYRTKNC